MKWKILAEFGMEFIFAFLIVEFSSDNIQLIALINDTMESKRNKAFINLKKSLTFNSFKTKGAMIIALAGAVEMTAQTNPNYPGGHNVMKKNFYQLNNANNNTLYTDWLRAAEKSMDASADSDCVNIVGDVTPNFDDSSITVPGNIAQSAANFHNYLVSIGADTNVLYTLFNNSQVDNAFWGYNSSNTYNASYLDQDAVNIVVAALHELLHGFNIEHDSGKLVNIEVNVGTAGSPNWIAFPQQVKTSISDGTIGGNYIQVDTTDPAKSTAGDDNFVYIPHPTSLIPDFARLNKNDLGHNNPALNALTILNNELLANASMVENLGDAETMNAPVFTINSGNNTILINNPADYSANIELISGSGEFIEDQYSVHFYDTSGNVIEGNKRRRFKSGQETSIPAGAVGVAIMNDDQNQITDKYYLDGSGTLNVAENNEITGLKIYPNPTTNDITIKANKTIENIEIYNTLGAKIQTIKNIDSNSTIISLSHFSQGMYIFIINTDRGSSVKRVIKD